MLAEEYATAAPWPRCISRRCAGSGATYLRLARSASKSRRTVGTVITRRSRSRSGPEALGLAQQHADRYDPRLIADYRKMVDELDPHTSS